MELPKNVSRERRKLDLEMATGIASAALAVEAMEQLLVERGILKENEVMERLGAMVKSRTGVQQ